MTRLQFITEMRDLSPSWWAMVHGTEAINSSRIKEYYQNKKAARVAKKSKKQ